MHVGVSMYENFRAYETCEATPINAKYLVAVLDVCSDFAVFGHLLRRDQFVLEERYAVLLIVIY